MAEEIATGTIGVGTRLFLTAAPDLEIGARLTSGHWREQVANWTVARSEAGERFVLEPLGPMALLEVVWEMVRLREFPDRPSRLDSRFLWSDEEEARAWHYRKHILPRPDSPQADRPTTTGVAGLYEVEVVACRRTCIANMSLISYLNDGETVDSLMKRARRYWRGNIAAAQGEVLLEGSVVVRRNLRSITPHELQAVEDPETAKAIRAAVCWQNEAGAPWIFGQTPAGARRLEGVLIPEPALPLPVAGWMAVEIEGADEPLPARHGTSPVLLRPGERCAVEAIFVNVPSPADDLRFRPILICDHAAAHYWQLQPHWEGTLRGEWQRAAQTPS